MSVQVVQVGDKYRLVENGSRTLAKTKTGAPVDGGGHTNLAKAERQALHVNTSKRREPNK